MTPQKKKHKEYQKYADRFAIIEFNNNIYLIKIIAIALNGYYAKIEWYEWDDFYKGFHVNAMEELHLSEFVVLKDFETMTEARKEYDEMLDAKKYNL